MKNVDKIIKNILILAWVGLNCSILKAEIVITEIFIKKADGTHTPQYVELYNNSNSSIDLEDWSITTLDDEGEIIPPGSTVFNSTGNAQINNTVIDAYSYFVISSPFCDYSPAFGCEFYNEKLSDILADFLILPFDDPYWNYIDKGSIVLTKDNNVVEDRIDYDILTWPVGENSRGHSLRLHSPELDNSLPENWSLSPETEKSIWLYNEGKEIKSFGSPREENSFRLQNIHYSDFWFSNIEIDNGGTHAIYGDVFDFYRAEPYKDFGTDNLPNTGDEYEGNGTWDLGEEYHDRNLNNIWDHQDNNYDSQLIFSWDGTSSSWLSNDELIYSNYEIIIEKKVTSIDSISFSLYNTSAINTSDTIRISNNTGTTMLISPLELLIDEFGRYREIAEYTWTVQLTKTFSTGSTDIIYSDKYSFFIDASDYGRYGCVDNGCCTNNPIDVEEDGCPRLCPESSYFDSLYKSNHPTVCTPGNDMSDGGCYSALNYYEYANINSNTCHYVSLSIPAFTRGFASDVVTVPVYLYNDSSANINSIAYKLSFDNSSSGFLSYDTITSSGTVISGLFDLNINDDDTDSITVNQKLSVTDSSFSGAGIITYLDFILDTLSQGAYTDLSLTKVQVKGDIPEKYIADYPDSVYYHPDSVYFDNAIYIPSKEGEIVSLQTNYEISGQVYYYTSPDSIVESFEVPNVEVKLNKNYDGNHSDTNYSDTTAESGSFRIPELTEGNYNLSFSKISEDDYCNNGISGWDLHYISHHVTGNDTLNEGQWIAADVSLDSTVSGYDVSLIAQYSVDLIDDYNDIKTHWIFRPKDQLNVFSELLEHNGIYSIEYKPLVLDDKTRIISAYRLGDVTGNYCQEPSSTSNRGQVKFTDIAIEYTPIITLPIIVSESTFIEGMDIEIGYDGDIFNPLSIIFNNSNEVVENYQTVSNLLSKDRTIKMVTWAIEEPQIVEGKIGEVSFNWKNKNKSGKIWLKEFQVNDVPADGGISIIGLSDNNVVDGVNIINSLVPVQLSLHQNYPNPFNPHTTIKWSMPLSGMVSLEVYNLQGQLVELLFNGQLEAGIHEQIWDSTAYPSGIYFYRMTINKKTLQKVMLLLK